MALLATIVVLGVLILVHELGHFWAAKAVGVKVLRFSIGLGPRVAGFQRGDTEYVISAIPLGGYVKMSGMADEVMEKVEGGAVEAPRAPHAARRARTTDFDGKPVWARALVLSAGVIMNMIFAFAAYTTIAASWGSAEVAETRLGYVDIASLPPGAESLAGLPAGARLTRVGDREVRLWSDVREGFLLAETETVTVETESPRMAVTVPVPGDPAARERLALALDYWLEAEVLDVAPGMPAARAGLRSGDRVLAVDGVAVDNWASLTREIMRRPGRATDFQVLRDGAIAEFTVTLASREERGPDGEVTTIGQAGITAPAPEFAYTPVPLGQAVIIGYRQTWATTEMILGFLGDLVTGNVSPRSVGSIVTIGSMSGQAAAAGIEMFLSFMALFSVNLAILNLLPIPVLDGGHLVFLGIEAVRGKALSLEQRLRWSQVGFVVIMGLMIWALSNDILRLFGL